MIRLNPHSCLRSLQARWNLRRGTVFPQALSLLAMGAVRLNAAPTYSTALGEGLTNDVFEVSQGVQVIAASPQHNSCCGNSDPRSILGFVASAPWIEPTRSWFADGPGPGFVDSLEWQTDQPVDLTGLSLRLEQDGPNDANRAATRFRIFASADGQNFSQISGGTFPGAPGANRHVPLLITDQALLGLPTAVRAFRLEVTRATARGVRVVELDGEGTSVAASGPFLDRLAFNAASNTLIGRSASVRDDEGPGRAVGFQVSSLVQDTDTPEDAFGNANGAVEPESFIFGDGGVSDNGNQILGDEGETVDFISWQLPEGIPLAGYRLTLSGDGTAQQNNRSAELVRFLVDGDEVDLFDNQAFNGSVNRVFAGGTRVGSDFRVELTRTTSGGPRLLEIDALIGPITPLNGEVVLNEIVSSNADSLRDENGDSSDWIEVFNGRDVPVSLAGWGLSDASDRPFRWRFPEVTLAPHTYLVVFASGKDRRVPGNNLHTNFQLKSDGERVVLTQPEGILRDGVELGRLRADVSYGRHPSGLGSWKFLATPTPRRSNTPQTPYDSVVFDAPAFSRPGGFQAEPFALILQTAEPGVTLHYTLDGVEPTEASPEYSSPLPISRRVGEPNVLSLIPGTATANQHTDGWKPPLGEVRKATVVRARATRPGGLAGPLNTQTYFVGAEAVRTDGLPTLSLTTDPAGFFDYDTGIYRLGAVFDRYVSTHPGEALTGHTPANYTQRGPAWEREAHLEWFEPDGTRAFGEPVRIDIQGQSSRSFRQKSFGLKARGIEPPRNTFSHSIFPGLTRLGDGTPLTEFRTLRLRNMGNDWDFALMRDDWCHRLAGGLGLNLMSSRFASVFLDGEYWGVLGVREQQDPRYLQAHYGIDDDEVVILSGAGGLEEGQPGDEQPWLDLLNFCETHHLAVPANYEHVAARIDPQDTLKYCLSEIYFGNADWPQNNLRVWRRRVAQPDASLGRGQDGRWRWLLFDIDLGTAHPWSAGVGDLTLQAALSPSGRPGFNAPWGTAVFRALMTHPAWKLEFINTAADLLNSRYSATHAAALVDTMRNELKPAMEEHIRRWRANGGSVAAWELRVRTLRDFALQRAAVVRQHVQTELKLSGSSRLTLGINTPGSGWIRVNQLLIDEKLPGTRVPLYPWTGFYFHGIPVTLEAQPAPGWRFDHWTGLTATGPVASVNPAPGLTCTAHFVADRPMLQDLQANPGGLRVTLIGRPGAQYGLQASANLGDWTDLGTVTCDPWGKADFEFPAMDTPERRYYRVLAQ